MKRFLSVFLMMLPLPLAACTKPRVVVQAELAQPGAGNPDAISGMPVRLLPYDRDVIIDSLTAAASQPEPRLPPRLAQQRDSLFSLQSEWREANERLTSITDSLATVPERSQSVNSLDGGRGQVKQRLDTLQARIALLRRATDAAADSMRIARREWAATALKDFDQIVQSRVQRADRGQAVDTTSQAGVAVFNVDEGRWWVYARYTLPTMELYWNFPVEVTTDNSRVLLTEENAEQRPLFRLLGRGGL